jgi:hypothetical protein
MIIHGNTMCSRIHEEMIKSLSFLTIMAFPGHVVSVAYIEERLQTLTTGVGPLPPEAIVAESPPDATPPHPLRQRIHDFVLKRDGKVVHTLRSGITGMFKFGKPRAEDPPSCQELVSWGMTLRELVDDEPQGCGLDLQTMHAAGMVTDWNHLMALKVTADDVLGRPDHSSERRLRLNPTHLDEKVLGAEVVQKFRTEFHFSDVYCERYASLLSPHELQALQVNLPALLNAKGKGRFETFTTNHDPKTVFSRYGPQVWVETTKLDASVLTHPKLGLGRTVAEAAKTLGWDPILTQVALTSTKKV